MAEEWPQQVRLAPAAAATHLARFDGVGHGDVAGRPEGGREGARLCRRRGGREERYDARSPRSLECSDSRRNRDFELAEHRPQRAAGSKRRDCSSGIARSHEIVCPWYNHD